MLTSLICGEDTNGRKGKGVWLAKSGGQVTQAPQGARSQWVHLSVELHCDLLCPAAKLHGATGPTPTTSLPHFLCDYFFLITPYSPDLLPGSDVN